MSKLFPIGTVVKTKDAPIKLMIVGYGGLDADETLHDYIGVGVPVGLFQKDAVKMFDDSQIEELSYFGYKDVDTQVYLTKVEEEFSDVLPALLGDEKEVEDV